LVIILFQATYLSLPYCLHLVDLSDFLPNRSEPGPKSNEISEANESNTPARKKMLEKTGLQYPSDIVLTNQPFSSWKSSDPKDFAQRSFLQTRLVGDTINPK